MGSRKRTGGLLLEELDVLGIHLDGGGEESGKVDDEPLLTGAALGEQTAFEPVETAADDADVLAVELGGYFLR